MILEFEIENETVLNFEIDGTVVIAEYASEYNGEYTVTPKVTPQELLTKDKKLKENITVKEIPYFETSNNYGTTVTIGG